MKSIRDAIIDDDVDFILFSERLIQLIEHGADLNTECMRGWAPIHVAARVGYLEIVKYLINQGAK